MTYCNKIFGFVKKVFFTGLTILSTLTSVNSLSFISMSNQKCKVRPQVANVNNDEPVFFPFSIKTSKCNGSCNNINDPYVNICDLDVVKNQNFKVFSLMSRTDETLIFTTWGKSRLKKLMIVRVLIV